MAARYYPPLYITADGPLGNVGAPVSGGVSIGGIDIPAGAKISSALLNVNIGTVWSAPKIDISAQKTIAAAIIGPSNPPTESALTPQTIGTVRFAPTAANTTHQIDVTALVSELIAQTDWPTSDARINFLMTDATGGVEVNFFEFLNNTNPPTLEITCD